MMARNNLRSGIQHAEVMQAVSAEDISAIFTQKRLLDDTHCKTPK